MENYMKFELLGKGCKGNCVFLVKSLIDNKLYAMKRIIIDEKDEKQNAKDSNEIEIFKSLKHPNLIYYKESFVEKGKLCIIMEYADAGDLAMVLKNHISNKKKIEEDLIWNWFLQLCQALKYIHARKILHRDIKCQNIFFMRTGQVKLGDFGISKMLKDSFELAKTPLGTPYFLSPEICSGNKYNFKTDMWMIGCLLYELTALHKPFEADNLPNLMHNILHNDIMPLPKSYSNELKTLISRLLCKEPVGRPSIREIFEMQFIQDKMAKLGLTKYYDGWNDWPKELPNTNEDNGFNDSSFNLTMENLQDYFNEIDLMHPIKNTISNPSCNSIKESLVNGGISNNYNKSQIKEENKTVTITNAEQKNDKDDNALLPLEHKSSCNIIPKINDLPCSPSNNNSGVILEKNYSQGAAIKSPYQKNSIEHQINQRKKSKGFDVNSPNVSLLKAPRSEINLNYHSNNSTKKKTKEIEFICDISESSEDKLKKTLLPTEIVTNGNYHSISIKYKFLIDKFGEEKMKQIVKEIEKCNGNLSIIQGKIEEIFESASQKTLFIFAKMIIKTCYGSDNTNNNNE